MNFYKFQLFEFQQDFKIFSDIQREYRNAATQNGIPNINDVNGSENEMTKIIAELAVSFVI